MQHWSTVGHSGWLPLRVSASVSAILVAVFVYYSCAIVPVQPIRLCSFGLCFYTNKISLKRSIFVVLILQCVIVVIVVVVLRITVSICLIQLPPTPTTTYRARAGYTTRAVNRSIRLLFMYGNSIVLFKQNKLVDDASVDLI